MLLPRAKRKGLNLHLLGLGLLAGVISVSFAEEQQKTFSLQSQDYDYEQHNFDPQEQGALLYRVAMQHLKPLEKSKVAATSNTNQLADDRGVLETTKLALQSIVHAMPSFWTAGDRMDNEDGSYTKSSSHDDDDEQDDDPLDLATRMLEKAADTYGNKDAMLTLADMSFYAKYTHPRDYRKAFKYYQALASTGNATAQQMVGFMYATGIGSVVKRDQAQALLYHTFAAHGGDTAAEMTLGYRYLFGIGTEQKCEDAAYYYQRVAEKAINYYLSGPPGGHSPPLPKVRLSDEGGGVYGYGASVMTDKRHRAGGGNTENSVSIQEVLQYWRYLAQTKSDFEAQLMLGQIYYQGTRSIPQDFNEAMYFFRQVTEKLPNGKVTEAILNSKRGQAIGQAAGYIGKMYWRGEGVEKDEEMAYQWFYLGSELNDSIAQNGLGMMYLNGVVVPKDREKAIEYFKRAAKHENPDAQVNLAIEYAKQESTLPLAIQLFTMAADSKHLLAYWYLAQLNHAGIGVKASCQVAVSFYKAIAEHGDWENPSVENAYAAYLEGDIEGALLQYMQAAERGYEIAQSNVAYLLDTDTRFFKITDFLGLTETPKADKDAERNALIYWSRSANQNNVDARVKMGDYYFRGIGTPVDYEKAAACYRIAAEVELSPMAMWNLGWMYENGLGVAQDFHLAKRSYDNALAASPDAYLPVKLSLAKLYLRYYWGWITGSDTGKTLTRNESTENDGWEDEAARARYDEQKAAAQAQQEARRRKEIEAYEYERARWEISSEEELRRKYSKHMKRLEREEGEDFMEMGTGGYERDEFSDEEYSEEDELIESLMILSLCILVGWLVYMRQFRFGNQQQPAAAGNNAVDNNNNNNNRTVHHPPTPPPNNVQ